MAPLDGAKALLAKEVDVLSNLTADGYEALKNEKSVRVLEQPGDMLWVIVPNLSSPPWNSLENRSGLLAALNREAMVKALEPAPAQVAFGWKAGPRYPMPAGAPLLKQSVKLFMAPVKSKDEPTRGWRRESSKISAKPESPSSSSRNPISFKPCSEVTSKGSPCLAATPQTSRDS